LGDADGDLLRLGFLALRKVHPQHAVPVVGLDLLGVDHAREGEGPAEAAVGALHPVVALLLDLVVELALAAEGQHAVLDPDVHVLGVHSRQLGLEHDVAVLLEDVDRGRPAPERPLLLVARGMGGAAEGLVEQAVHAALDRDQVTERFPANDCHDLSSFLAASVLRAGHHQFFAVYSASTTSPWPWPSGGPGGPPGAAVFWYSISASLWLVRVRASMAERMAAGSSPSPALRASTMASSMRFASSSPTFSRFSLRVF